MCPPINASVLTHTMHAIIITALLHTSLCVTTALLHTSFCVATARRRTSYLPSVVQSFADQNIFRSDGVGLIIVDVDNSTGGSGTAAIPLPNRIHAVCDTPDVEGIPSCHTRQLSLDIIGALTLCSKHTSGWVVLAEDDCTICEGGVDEIVTALSTLNSHTISLAKFAGGLHGVAFPSSKVPLFTQYVRDRLYTHPHDITRIEDWDPAGGVLYTHPRNLFHHIGTVSTEERKNTDEFREKYRDLREDFCWQSLNPP